jgi:dephospho-CoA kinase
MILKIGLTGGIASGKSTVGRHLAELGAVVIDADRVVHELYRPGEAGYHALVDRYGEGVLAPDGQIDRPRLSRTALTTPERAEELNQLIHPLVIEEEAHRIASIEAEGRDRVVVVEATLLLESGGKARYDRIIVVDTDPETQVQRAVARGLSKDEAILRMSRQMSRQDRLALADFVVDSSGSVADTLARVDAVWANLTTELSRKK